MEDKGEGIRCTCTRVIGRTAIPFLRKYVVPETKRISADKLEFAAPEIGDVLSGKKSFKPAAKNVGKQTLRKQLGEGERSRRREPQADGKKGAAGVRQGSRVEGGSKQRKIIPTKSAKQFSRS